MARADWSKKTSDVPEGGVGSGVRVGHCARRCARPGDLSHRGRYSGVKTPRAPHPLAWAAARALSQPPNRTAMVLAVGAPNASLQSSYAG